jgi:hypothetical protein
MEFAHSSRKKVPADSVFGQDLFLIDCALPLPAREGKLLQGPFTKALISFVPNHLPRTPPHKAITLGVISTLEGDTSIQTMAASFPLYLLMSWNMGSLELESVYTQLDRYLWLPHSNINCSQM